jgi:hypothetical protein
MEVYFVLDNKKSIFHILKKSWTDSDVLSIVSRNTFVLISNERSGENETLLIDLNNEKFVTNK